MQATGVLPVRLPAPLALTLYAKLGLLLPGGAAAMLLITGLAENLTKRQARRANFCTG
jgi:hypothetical protein